MNIHILVKLCWHSLENNINAWLESHGKRVEGQVVFRRHHSNIDHLVTLRIIAKECRNIEIDLLCYLFYFRKAFSMVPRDKLWQRLEEIMVPRELRVVVIRLYANVVSKIKTTKGRSKEIKCNIGVKQGCPLSPTLFGIYIDKLEAYLEATGCVGPKLVGMVITLLVYVDDIVLLAKSYEDLDK